MGSGAKERRGFISPSTVKRQWFQKRGAGGWGRETSDLNFNKFVILLMCQHKSDGHFK